jgi:GntR family transcriptional repressor for pyruvate dehydrogenase complex
MANVKRAAIATQGDRIRALRPIKRESLNQQILSRLRTYLDQDRLRVGSRLPSERDLATLLRVSRPSIREVLKALSIMGIVKSKQGQGTYLEAPIGTIVGLRGGTFNLRERLDLVEVAEARSTIEPVVASLAARRASDLELGEITKELQAMQDNLKNPKVFLQHDLHLHLLILRACGNAVLRKMLTPVLEHLYSYRHKLRAYGNPPHILLLHKNLVRALQERSSRAAHVAMSRHMEATRAYYLQLSRDGPKANQS